MVRQLIYKPYISSRKEREDYRRVVFVLMALPSFASLLSFEEIYLALISLFILFVWGVALRKNWKVIRQQYYDTRKKKTYIQVAVIITVSGFVIGLLAGKASLLLVFPIVYIWGMFQVNALFGEEPEIIEDV